MSTLASTDANAEDALDYYSSVVTDQGPSQILPSSLANANGDDTLPLAIDDDDDDTDTTTDLESDVVIYAAPPSSSFRKYTKPAALLLALLALLTIAIAVGVNKNNDNGADNALSSSQQQIEAEPKQGAFVRPAATNKDDNKPPKKEEGHQKPVRPLPAPATPFPTDGSTVTVNTAETAPPTLEDRPSNSSIIESPTWRG